MPADNSTDTKLGYEGEVDYLRTSEPVLSVQFISQIVLTAICVLAAWYFLDLWEALVWFVCFCVTTTVEKVAIWRMPDRISTAHFNWIRSILFVDAVVFDALPVYLWFHEDDPLKLGALAIVTGFTLNSLNTRARYASILSAVQIPNAMLFPVIGVGLVWQQGFSPAAMASCVVSFAIAAFFFVNLRDAHLREKAAAETKEQLQYAQRAEVLGQVTGGIAHDFNNILSVVNASLELLREDKMDPDELKLIDQALIGVENGANLTRQMLAFGRRAPLVPDIVDVNASLQTLRNLVVRVMPATIKFSVESDPDLAAIKVDESAFHSAMINLALNACNAMPDGGSLTIRAQNTKIYSGRKAEQIVTIRVTDTGTGIAKDIQGRVFDPFFTTNEVGEGSGLGLSMVKGFAEQSGGAVTLFSRPGSGTTIILTFPAVSDAISKPTDPVQTGAQMTTGAHILVVDDNEQMLSLLSTKLQRDGHQVSAFASGDEAVVALQRGIMPDLILSDVVMPGKVQGTDLLILTRREYRKLPIILMSGYADLGERTGTTGPRPDAFLDKPVHLSDLTDLIQRLLHRAS